MNATQQHMIDLYRAAQRGETPPPPPGQGDLAALRSVREYRRFRRVLAGRPAGPSARRPGTAGSGTTVAAGAGFGSGAPRGWWPRLRARRTAG
ncbi:hypothetical protein NX801_26045 [Streptomyces sp. LP05-1]|uniref:Uncharacterized protein n=1 Tax=Streptomyces pyxinae TaxID=2970734 RepID=A0ABT2CQT8_9ACTN|nr:hypothetical protein [Streptomyces sp. LP05-1]MCS0639046.1 hypothetical protein [Streptomyces sp. LP05-1]